MCGIIGLMGTFEQKQATLEQACQRIRERGPDSQGVWLSVDQQLGLAHVRLAIQDLSVQGHQPMLSQDGRYVLVFNGEIYNHLALRTQFSQHVWRGHSDTETLLVCFEHWGVATTLQKLVGMFAFALWDNQARTLTLGRDRFGEKPLYYAQCEQGIGFASDLKALMPIHGFNKQLNRQAVTLLLRHNYIPAPYSIFEDCYKLPPASYLVLSQAQIGGELPKPVAYWSAYDVAKLSTDRVFASDEMVIDAFEALLSDTVKGQMLADVKLGAFLSGGTDSSLIAAMMQKQSTQAIKTFAIGFKEEKYNEAPFAKAVAQHLGTDHTELYMDGNDGLAIFEKMPSVYSEPFADSSQLPAVVMMKMTSEHVKVALSGDAGDELFGGYNRYVRAQYWWQRCQKLPAFAQTALRKLSEVMSKHYATHPEKTSTLMSQMKWEQLALLLQAKDSVAFYKPFVSYWKFPERLVIDGSEPATAFANNPLSNLLRTMMITDTLSYLPDDILVKVDRAAMFYSLETRVPLLDHRLFEFVWDIHPNYRTRQGVNKWLMKELLYRHVPKTLLDRPKKGFSVPLGEWLKGPMKTWAADLLSQQRLQQQGLLKSEYIQQAWNAHLDGKGDWSAHLWGVLMLQAWIEAYQIRV